jgi:hypothetical protein
MDGQVYGLMLWVWLLTTPLLLGIADLIRLTSRSTHSLESNHSTDRPADQAMTPRLRG